MKNNEDNNVLNSTKTDSEYTIKSISEKFMGDRVDYGIK